MGLLRDSGVAQPLLHRDVAVAQAELGPGPLTAQNGKAGERRGENGGAGDEREVPAANGTNGHAASSGPSPLRPRRGGPSAHRRPADWLALRAGRAVSRLDGAAGEPLARWRTGASAAGPAEAAIGWKLG